MNILGNNLPGTVLCSFIKSTEVWGWPLQVQGDRGREHLSCHSHDTKEGGLKRVVHVGHVSLVNYSPLILLTQCIH